MEKIGFIGLGSMGGALLQGLLESGAFSQKEVLVSTRTKEKIKGLISMFPEVQIADSNIELTRIVPSLTCQAGQSVTLVFHNPMVAAQEASRVEKWLACFGLVKVIDEDHFETK